MLMKLNSTISWRFIIYLFFNKSAIDYAKEENHQDIVNLLSGKFKTVTTKGMSSMNKEIQKLTNENKGHVQDIHKLEATNQHLSTENAQLKGENAKLRDETVQLKRYLAMLAPKRSNITIYDEDAFQKVPSSDKKSIKTHHKVVKKEPEQYFQKVYDQFTCPSTTNFFTEATILSELQHPCVIPILGVFYGNQILSPAIYLPLMPSNLSIDILNHSLSKVQKNLIAVEIVLGMRYIHQNKYIHCNLNPSNILLTKKKHVRICSFGRALKEGGIPNFKKDQIYMSSFDFLFRAPETLDDDEAHYSFKSDVYAFGFILLFILEGQYPKCNLKAIMAGKLPKIPDDLPIWVTDLITKSLSADPNKRPNFNEIWEIMKANNFDLFHDALAKASGKKRSRTEIIERRILKIQSYEYSMHLASLPPAMDIE